MTIDGTLASLGASDLVVGTQTMEAFVAAGTASAAVAAAILSGMGVLVEGPTGVSSVGRDGAAAAVSSATASQGQGGPAEMVQSEGGRVRVDVGLVIFGILLGTWVHG